MLGILDWRLCWGGDRCFVGQISSLFSFVQKIAKWRDCWGKFSKWLAMSHFYKHCGKQILSIFEVGNLLKHNLWALNDSDILYVCKPNFEDQSILKQLSLKIGSN